MKLKLKELSESKDNRIDYIHIEPKIITIHIDQILLDDSTSIYLQPEEIMLINNSLFTST